MESTSGDGRKDLIKYSDEEEIVREKVNGY